MIHLRVPIHDMQHIVFEPIEILQVDSPVVKAVSVLVVTLQAGLSICDQAVHLDSFPSAADFDSCHSIPANFTTHRPPGVFRQH